MLIVLLLVVVLVEIDVIYSNPELQITIDKGTLKGQIWENRVNQKPIYGFLNIPYAQPPIQEKRFEAPEEPLPWEGVLDKSKKECIKYNPIFQNVIGDEDCLYLHVYTSENPKDIQELRPVMVWIHGGAFHSGSGGSDSYGPDFLLTEDVVLVAMNYRLNVFGFLSFNNRQVPGNNGLKDQIMALKWVKKNIKAFGGDPEKVTIFGESAGGASVHYLLLAPGARGLFHGAIAQSGCVLNPWASTANTRQAALEIAEIVNCNSTDDDELLNCLKNAKTNELASYQYNAMSPFADDRQSVAAFLPSIEPKDSVSPIFTENSKELLREGKFADVPFMIGTVEMETLPLSKLFTGPLPPRPRKFLIKNLNKDHTLIIPINIKIEDANKRNRVAAKLKEFYFQNRSISEKTKINLIRETTDTTFLWGVHDSVNYHTASAKSPVYQYYFVLDTDYGRMKSQLSLADPGPSHADELGYLFAHYSSLQDLDPENKGYQGMLKMVKMWTNFAKFGNPTPDDELGIKWKPSKVNERFYLEIGENLVLKENVEKERMDFWEKLKKEEDL